MSPTAQHIPSEGTEDTKGVKENLMDAGLVQLSFLASGKSACGNASKVHAPKHLRWAAGGAGLCGVAQLKAESDSWGLGTFGAYGPIPSVCPHYVTLWNENNPEYQDGQHWHVLAKRQEGGTTCYQLPLFFK